MAGLGISSVSVQGVVLQVGNGSSPETFQTIVNISKFTFPTKAKVVDVTNVSNIWKQQIPTLLEIGDLTCEVFWVMEDPTLNSQVGGLRYLFANKLKRDFQITYNDGNNSTDAFQAYVTTYQITGQVADVFKAQITLSGTGQPQLV